MVAETLKELDGWFKEITDPPERSRLLSKLAILELCGWLEEELDRIILALENPLLQDDKWVKKEVLNRTNGFHYDKHFRSMVCRLLGEVTVRRVEKSMDEKYPGQLDILRVKLDSLWKKRCAFAHADMASNIVTLQTFDAPSWTINEFAAIEGALTRLESVLIEVSFVG